MIKIKFMYFWEGFNNKNNFLIDILKFHNINFELSDNLNELNYIIFGCFIYNFSEKKILLNYPSHIKKILYVTEALSVFYHVTWDLYLNNYFNYITGSIQNNSDNQIHYKFPFFTIYYDYKNTNFYKDINNFVVYQDISLKQNICLINSHDIKKSRTPIYNSLVNKGIHIVCPGKLFNNASNEELNSMGKYEYLKKFIFNICPENTKTLPNGYITEKLLECCKSGCIPIYCGSFDNIDEKIFNKDRIIFYDYESEEYITNCCIKVIELLNDKNKLEIFYKQSPFMDTAYDTLMNLENNFCSIFT
jgi:hypothetical protein